MRLEQLTPAHVRRAVTTYMRLAWSDVEHAKPRFDPSRLDGLSSLEDIFSLCEKPEGGASTHAARYTMRLGNDRYPFMKFVVQEYLVDEEYFFSVDTHDDHVMGSEDPDWDQWCDLRKFNRDLKSSIEAQWEREDLPTHADLRTLAEGLAQLEREEEKRARLLIVDDEQDVCRGLGALLEARGYEVELAYNGQEVLDRLSVDPVPDLVVLDFSMPGLDGEQVLKHIRDDRRLEDMHVLMATASSIDLQRVQRASGLLRKPYPREVLIAMVKQILAQKQTRRGD